MRRLEPDFLFSCYYRHMLKKPLLDLPRRGALNLHGSLLPRYRGRCPVNWVLINGETETGVTLHYMEEKPDKGDIVGQETGRHHPGGHRPHPVCPDDGGRRGLNAGDLPPAAGRHRPPPPPGPEPGLLFRRPPSRRRPHFLGQRRRWRYIIWSGPSPTPTPGPSPSFRARSYSSGPANPWPRPGCRPEAAGLGGGRRCRGRGCWWPPARATSSSPRPSGRASRSFWGRSSPPGIIWWGKNWGKRGIGERGKGFKAFRLLRLLTFSPFPRIEKSCRLILKIKLGT